MCVFVAAWNPCNVHGFGFFSCRRTARPVAGGCAGVSVRAFTCCTAVYQHRAGHAATKGSPTYAHDSGPLAIRASTEPNPLIIGNRVRPNPLTHTKGLCVGLRDYVMIDNVIFVFGGCKMNNVFHSRDRGKRLRSRTFWHRICVVTGSRAGTFRFQWKCPLPKSTEIH